MQINNSINTNSDTLYRNEKKTKSLNSSFDLKTAHSSNETVNEEKKTGTADIQELYKANASNNKLVVRFSLTQQIASSLFLSIFPCFITTNDFNMVKKSL